MILIELSDGLCEDVRITCIICGQSIPAQDAAAGSLYADGSQAFACNAHMRDRPRWISAWALFNASQCNTSQQQTQPAQPVVKEVL